MTSAPTGPVGRTDGQRFASAVDASVFGEYPPRLVHDGGRPVRVSGRIVADAAGPPRPGRYHLYAGWFCPRSHRAAIVRRLCGLDADLGVSYVHGMRDARGWAFREPTGPDHVNGLPLLRDVYRLGAPGYRGPISVPLLWDLDTGRVLTNDPDTIDLDLATAFDPAHAAALVPPDHAADLDAAFRGVTALGQAITRAVVADSARADLRTRLAALDTLLSGRRFLVGDALTLADVRLWVLLARYDVGPNATGAAGPRLTSFTRLWGYARRLYAVPAFRTSTDFAAFAAPLTPVPPWES